MSVVALLISAALGLTAAFYAHSRIPQFTAKAGNVALLRLILLATGLALGYAMMDRFSGPAVSVLSFCAWFGAVHVPAACILVLKGLKKAGKS